MLTLEMLNNSKYKDATLVAEIKKINYFFNSISLIKIKINKEKYFLYCKRIENQICIYFELIINDKKNIKKRIEHLQGIFCLTAFLQNLINKGFDKKDITFPTFRQKEIIYESLKKVTSYSKVRISYLRKIDLVIMNNSNKLNENKVIMPVKIEPLSIVNYANYIFEKIDPLHRKLSDDELLSAHKKKFMEKNYKFNDLEFLLYIDDLPEAETYDSKFWQSKVQVFYPKNEIIRNYLFAAKYDAKNKKLIAPLGFLNSTKGLKGLFLFVIDLTGKLYISVLCKPKVHHSSFKSGDDIISAGFIEILDGKITTIINSSGHYQPRLSHLIYAINSFTELKIFDINAKVNEYNENNRLCESLPINEWLNKKIEILEKLSRAGLLHEKENCQMHV